MADEDLRNKLTPEQYNITQEAGTEEVFKYFLLLKKFTACLFLSSLSQGNLMITTKKELTFVKFLFFYYRCFQRNEKRNNKLILYIL